MSTPDKNIFKELIRWVDPREDLNSIDLKKGPVDKLALHGAILGIKLLIRGGVAGALVGTITSHLADGKISEGAIVGGTLGILAEVAISVIRITNHSNKS